MAEGGVSAFEQLRRDHKEVLEQLAGLEMAVAPLKDDPEGRPVPALGGFVAFIEREVWTHFDVEEEALFPLIRDIFPAENAPIIGGPVFVLTEEHGVLRRLVTRMRESLEGWENDAPGARDAFLLVAPQVIRAFQKHIYKEDNIVFRLAETYLSPEARATFEADFARLHP